MLEGTRPSVSRGSTPVRSMRAQHGVVPVLVAAALDEAAADDGAVGRGAHLDVGARVAGHARRSNTMLGLMRAIDACRHSWPTARRRCGRGAGGAGRAGGAGLAAACASGCPRAAWPARASSAFWRLLSRSRLLLLRPASRPSRARRAPALCARSLRSCFLRSRFSRSRCSRSACARPSRLLDGDLRRRRSAAWAASASAAWASARGGGAGVGAGPACGSTAARRGDLRHGGPQLGAHAGGRLAAPVDAERQRHHQQAHVHQQRQRGAAAHAAGRLRHQRVGACRVSCRRSWLSRLLDRQAHALDAGALQRVHHACTTASYLTLRVGADDHRRCRRCRPAPACTRAGELRQRRRAPASLPVDAQAQRLVGCRRRSRSRARGRCLALPTLGRSITPVVISGAVTMKMISSTSITSMNGTMLISFIVRRRRGRGR